MREYQIDLKLTTS